MTADSKKIDDGGTAFPVPEENRLSDGTYCNEGMSLRDWFAGQALAGITASLCSDVSYGGRVWFSQTAQDAYKLADAMIAARKAGA